MRTQEEIDKAAHLLATKLKAGGRHVTDATVYDRLIDLYSDEDWTLDLRCCYNTFGYGLLDGYIAWCRQEDEPPDIKRRIGYRGDVVA